MAATPSVMIPLGSIAPPFKLYDTNSGKSLSLENSKGKVATVVMFICNHCPYVKHLNHEIIAVANGYQRNGIKFIAISSNDAEAYPEDGPEKMTLVAKELGYPFPYLYDDTQQVARAYDAACTPDFFVYDSGLRLVYRGQFDDSRPKNDIKPTGKDLRNALDLLLAGKQVPEKQTPSIGCNIKWRK
jgi:peroxiredoxin